MDAEKLTQLRLAVEIVRRELIDAEAEMADQRADIEVWAYC